MQVTGEGQYTDLCMDVFQAQQGETLAQWKLHSKAQIPGQGVLFQASPNHKWHTDWPWFLEKVMTGDSYFFFKCIIPL